MVLLLNSEAIKKQKSPLKCQFFSLSVYYVFEGNISNNRLVLYDSENIIMNHAFSHNHDCFLFMPPTEFMEPPLE